MEAGVVALVLVDCIWFSAAAVAVLGSLDAALAADPPTGSAACALPEPEVALLVGVMLDNVWLIEMS